MSLQIIPIEAGINTFYLIRDEGAVLFDGGWSKGTSQFSDLLKQNGIKPDEIKLIVLSHGDFDHVGGTKVLKELTGARVAIHEEDRQNLEEGIFHWAKGVTAWGKVSRALFKPMMVKSAGFPGVKADMVLDDHDFSLEPFGIRGRVVHTPGHTRGSVSILLDSGEAFIGCLAHNRFPFVLKPSLPIYADDIALLKKSWKKVIDHGATILYPGHGKPFTMDRITRYLN